MRKTQLASLVIRIISTYFLIYFILWAPTHILMALAELRSGARPGSVWPLVASVAACVFLVALCIAMNVGSKRVGRLLISNDETPIDLAPLDKADVAALAFACIGMFFVLSSLPSLLRHCLALLLFDRRGIHTPYFMQQYVVGLAGSLLQLAAGLAVFLGAKGLVKLWRAIRS